MTRRGNGDHPMAVAVRRQPPLWRPTFDPTASQVEFVGDKVSLGRVARLDPTVAQVEFMVDKVSLGRVALLLDPTAAQGNSWLTKCRWDSSHSYLIQRQPKGIHG